MWKMGNPGLTQLWGATGEDPLSLDDLSSPAKPIKDMEYFKTQIRKQEEIQERRKQDLTGDSEPTLRQLAEDSEWSEAEDVSVCR